MKGVADRVREADARIREHVRRTPLVRSEALSATVGHDVFLKLENLQVTGSFKIRGVLNKLLTLSNTDLSRGVVAASTGNHGLAVAHGTELLGARATIVLPETADPTKIARLEGRGVRVEIRGVECAEAECWARAFSMRSGMVYVSPYNDPDVVAGQGTIGSEVAAELGSVGAIFASVGGGGLIAGVAGFLAESGSRAHAVGCLPRNSPVMYDSMMAGRVVESPILQTLSDSTAGGVEPGAITFELCRRFVDDWVLVGEDGIRRAMALVYDEHDLIVEGAAGVAIAGLLESRDRLRGAYGGTAVVIVCGGNIDRGSFQEAVGPFTRRGPDRHAEG